MNWLFDIFSSTSDQARLVTTLIAAFIAIVVVLANQWFTSKRTRNLKLIEKIEETYLSVIKLEELFSTIHNEIVSNYHIYNPEAQGRSHQIFDKDTGTMMAFHVDELNVEFYKTDATATMLSGLYFSELKNAITAIKDNYQRMYLIFCESESLSEYLDQSDLHRKRIRGEFEGLYANLQTIMNRYMH